MIKFLPIHLPAWILLYSLGCWATLASASEVLVTEIKTPAPVDSRRHDLTKMPNGRLLLSWTESLTDGAQRLRFAVLEGGHWSTPRTVVTVDQKFTKFSGPPVMLGLGDGVLVAAWLIKRNKTDNPYGGRNYIYLSRSRDGGKSWSEPILPYSSKTRAYGTFVSLTALGDGRLALVWTDKRYHPRYQIRATVVDWDGKPNPQIVLDDNVCPCCKFETIYQDGMLSTVYRDHLPGEVRNIGFVRWSAADPVKSVIVHDDNWVIAGCPANGPAVAGRDGLAVVSWFTVAHGESYVRTAFLPEGQSDFGDPIQVDDHVNGYVNVLLLENGAALVAWRDQAGPTEKLKLARVHQEGTVDEPTMVFRGLMPGWPDQRISLVQIDNVVYVSWKDAVANRIRLAKVPLASLITEPSALATRY